MDTINTNINKNNKIELALASLMFFGPLIKHNLKTRNDIPQEDKKFIKGFIKLGFFNIALLILAIALEITSYITNVTILDTIGTIIIVILAVLLLVGSILAISEKNIFNTGGEDTTITTKNDVLQTISGYIPLYNVYQRYNKHDFEGENYYLKESLILWGIFSIILTVTTNKYILCIFGSIIIISMMINIFQINFGPNYTGFIKKIFKKNPEEIWGSLIGILIAPFSKDSTENTIESYKEKYSLIFKLDHKQILLELIILIILSCVGIYLNIKSSNYSIFIGILLILGRYVLMLVKWKHITHIPIIKEITSIFFIHKKTQND